MKKQLGQFFTKHSDYIPYIGSGAYCYSNSTAMLLTSIGETISPNLIEPLTGVGLGVTFEKNGFLFFSHSNLLPDLGICKALDALGFSYQSKFSQTKSEFPIEELKRALAKGPVILGPLDMGCLIYNPDSKLLKGVDHFVLAYDMKDKDIFLHDPAGFPCVKLSLKCLKDAWMADNILYRQGYYRYITSVKRIAEKNKKDIFKFALKFFKQIYKQEEDASILNGSEAILHFVNDIRTRGMSEAQRGHLASFVFPLGAKRALDFSNFFAFGDKILSKLKYQQANLFGEAQVATMENNLSTLIAVLNELAESERNIGERIIGLKIN